VNARTQGGRGPADDAGSIALAMLLTVLALALTSLVFAANDDDGNGLLASLPSCNGVLTGQVNGANSVTYAVTVTYFTAANAVLCTSGKPVTVPDHAVLTSVGGMAGEPTRTQQRFAYYDDLRVVLVGSQPQMCLDADTPHAAAKNVRLQNCASPAPAPQRWVANKYANFEGTGDSVNSDGTCFNVKTPDTVGSDVILGTKADGNCLKPHDNKETFIPEPTVGAGAAGPPQLVNYEQFGRCLDVPGNDPSAETMISWPCKQAFDRSTIASNESWALRARVDGPGGSTGRITTYEDSEAKTYCLQSPGLTATPYATLSATCPTTSIPVHKRWTVYWDTGDYSTSYRIQDGYGNCLQPTDLNATPPDLYPSGDQISKVIVAVCGASTLQKWNAPPNITGVLPLRNVSEK